MDLVKNIWCKALPIFLLGTSFVFAQKEYKLSINTDIKYQTMDNFGAAACWFGEGVGKYWPKSKKEGIAKLLFSKATDSDGNPEGIGLTAWRFNIGAGTQEQGEQSGISDFRKRVECFQNTDGTYDWSKQSGYVWLVQKAKEYGVEKLIAFSNSPPVQFTKNGLGFKTEKDKETNLKADKFDDFAEFLSTVVDHFEKEGIHFDYVSPVNEPQWDWFGEVGKAKQEGTPWSNEDISKLTKLLDASLASKKLDTQILLSESAQLNFLYDGYGSANDQVTALFAPQSSLYVGDLSHVAPLFAGHSYFTDTPDTTMIGIRRKVKDITEKNNIDFWQSEYSMLANGFREGNKGERTAMDCALFLAKVIHYDLTEANASAWQFWNTLEPGNADFDTRYYFIALNPNDDHTDGEYYPVKNLWAMGHYSYFVRPGMQRIDVTNQLNPEQAAQNFMASAYLDPTTDKLVLVMINYSPENIQVDFDNAQLKKYRHIKQYLTSSDKDINLQKVGEGHLPKQIVLPKRTISTLVLLKSDEI